MGDTIAAISTPPVAGGIGIVRISGGEAAEIADKVFKSVRSLSLAKMKGYTAAYGHVYDNDEIIDEAIALVFIAPRSYTGEDVIELSCHGGIYILRRLLKAVISAGARNAEAGEFTKRAFLNGKIDLTKAESVMDLINAQGKLAASAALSQHEGALFKSITEIKTTLIEIASNIAAWVDFPDDDIPGLEINELKGTLSSVSEKLFKLIKHYETGRIIREGVDTVIAGKPNVGKSTIMNLLTGYERSIVTEVAGTTRDIVEDSVRLGDIVLRLSDTAGLRNSEDIVEKIGVSRAREKLNSASLIFAVFDSSRPLDDNDRELIDAIKDKAAIAVINKSDLISKIDIEYINSRIKQTVVISAIDKENTKLIEQATLEVLNLNNIEISGGILANERQLEAALRAKDGIDEAYSALSVGYTLDAVSVGIESAIEFLSQLTGEAASEQIIARIFEKFCIGK